MSSDEFIETLKHMKKTCEETHCEECPFFDSNVWCALINKYVFLKVRLSEIKEDFGNEKVEEFFNECK